MCAGGLVLKIEKVFKFIVAMVIYDGETSIFYLVFTLFNLDMVLGFPMLLHAWTDLKSIFLDFVCRKVLSCTKKNSWLAPYFGGI